MPHAVLAPTRGEVPRPGGQGLLAQRRGSAEAGRAAWWRTPEGRRAAAIEFHWGRAAPADSGQQSQHIHGAAPCCCQRTVIFQLATGRACSADQVVASTAAAKSGSVIKLPGHRAGPAANSASWRAPGEAYPLLLCMRVSDCTGAGLPPQPALAGGSQHILVLQRETVAVGGKMRRDGGGHK